MLLPAIQLWELQITEDSSAGGSFVLREGSLSLGSSPDCEIVSRATGIAPRHAEFSVNAGALQLRIFDGAAPAHLNGAPVRGTVDIPCPATITVGDLRVFITHSGATPVSRQNSDSTIRIVHPASPRSQQFADPEGLDVTGRIVYQLPDAEGAAPAYLPSSTPGLESQKTSASFSSESTMAFSMESLDLEIADKVPVRIDYAVKGEIARGGMGKIYSAEDSELDRLVALKVSTAGDRGRDSQFFREAKILAALAHPNIVPIHNLGVDAEGRPFYSMKLIQGRTLQWILKQLAAGDRSIALVYTRDRLLDIFRKVCDAVSFAHSKGYLHRDLKPENIMVGEFGEVLVMDWGLAKVIRKTAPGGDPAAGADVEPETLSYIEGTPQYMSPEQANGIYGGLDERSDIYSLGGVLYAILTYRPPVSGASVAEVIQKVRSGETTTMAVPRRSGAGADPAGIERAVPEALRAVTLKALAREKTKRYQSVSALVADIEAYQSGFATGAEDASLFRQVWLLVKRHRMAAALMFLFACGGVVFAFALADSEKTALANAERAEKERKNAEKEKQHSENEARAASEQKLLAQENARRADAEKYVARQALAQTQLTLAEASEQRFNAEEMDTALRKVDPEFRTQEWEYLNNVLSSGTGPFEAKAGSIWKDCVPHPTRPGVMLTLQSDNLLRILDLNVGSIVDLFQLDGRIDADSLAVSPDGALVAVLEILASKPGTAADKHQISVWNLGTEKKVKAFEVTPRCDGARLKFSPDGSKLMKVCTGSKKTDADLSMFEVETGKKLWRFPCDGSPYDAEFEPKYGRVHYASTTERFELNSGDGLRTKSDPIPFQGTSKDVPTLMKALHVFKTSGANVWRYDADKPSFEVKFPGKQIESKNLVVSVKDGYFAALAQTGDSTAVVQVRQLDYGDIVKTVPILIDGHRGMGWRLAAHPDSGHYAVLRGKTMRAWNITRYSEKTRLGTKWSHATATGFAFLNTPDEILQFSLPKEDGDTSQAFTVDVRRIKDSEPEIEREVDKFTCPKSFVPHFSASRDGRIIAALTRVEDKSGSPTSRLTTYRVQSDGAIVQQPPIIPVVVGQMQVSPDGEKVRTAVGVIETSSGEMIQKHPRFGAGQLTYEYPEQWRWTDNTHVVEITLVSDPSAAEAGVDRSLVLWSSEHSGPLIPPVSAPNANTLSASPNGTTIAEGGKDGRVRLRDAKTLEVLKGKAFRVHDGPVTDVAWHPTLPLLATASEDRTVRIWNVETGKLVEEFGLFHRHPQRIDWSPDGRNLAVLHTYARCFLKPVSCQVQEK